MFCRNCGSKLPDDARFCNTCGAKVEAVAAVEKTNSYVDNMPFGNASSRKETEPASSMSFDWSGVIDESHKRKTPEVQSPWGSTGLGESTSYETESMMSAPKQTRYSNDDFFADLEKPSQEPSRTMSFIDILKAERLEKEQEAARFAEPVTQRREAAPDFSAFDNADGFSFENDILPRREREVTQGYTDMDLDIAAEVGKRAAGEPARRYATPVDEADDIASSYLNEGPAKRPSYEAPSFEQAFAYDDEDEADYSIYDMPEEQPRRYARAVEPVEESPVADFKQAESRQVAGAAAASVAETPVEDLYADEDRMATKDLEAELAAILGGGAVAAGAAAAAEAAPVVEPVAPVVEAVAPAVEEAAPAVAVPEESEIDVLKKRLAELMGEPTEEPVPVAEHPVPSVEELFADEPVAPVTEAPAETPNLVANTPEPVAEAPADGADIFAMFEDEPAAPAPEAAPVAAAAVASAEPVAAAPVAEVAPVEAAPVAEESASVAPAVAAAAVVGGAAVGGAAVAAVAETDAMSIDELEKDLFGDEFAQDAEAEATKKIDKFYTLYKKNEEFQKLLDEEYNKLQGEEPVVENEMSELDALLAQQQPVAQMSMPAAAASSFVEPEVAPQSSLADLVQPVQQPVQPVQQPVQAAQQAVQQADPIDKFVAPTEFESEKALSKKELKAQKKAAKKAAKNKPVEDDDDDEGGNALTIIAVVIAVLLVILLGVILILNFAPDSGLGMKLDSLIQNITSYFSVLDGMNDEFLL